jgi:hypothetical protein
MVSWAGLTAWLLTHSRQKLFNRTTQEHQYRSWLTRVGLPCLAPDCCAIFTAGRREREREREREGGGVFFNGAANF